MVWEKVAFKLVIGFLIVGCAFTENRNILFLEQTPTQNQSIQVDLLSSPTPSLQATRPPTETPNAFINPFNHPHFSTPNPLANLLEAAWAHPSPNGVWLAGNGVDLEIFHISGEKIWELPIAEASQRFQGAHFSALQWSPDERYLYFSMTDFLHNPILLHNAGGYWRLDIITGDIEEFIPIDDDPKTLELRSVSLSPDGNKIAYFPSETKSIIIIIDVDSKEETIIELGKDFDDAGYIAWSPKQDQLVFLGVQIPEKSDYETIENEYTIVDLNTGKLNLLFSNLGFPRKYTPHRWSEDNIIEFNWCKIWYFDLNTNEFTAQATPTPNPAIYPEAECDF